MAISAGIVKRQDFAYRFYEGGEGEGVSVRIRRIGFVWHVSTDGETWEPVTLKRYGFEWALTPIETEEE